MLVKAPQHSADQLPPEAAVAAFDVAFGTHRATEGTEAEPALPAVSAGTFRVSATASRTSSNHILWLLTLPGIGGKMLGKDPGLLTINAIAFDGIIVKLFDQLAVKILLPGGGG